MTAIRSEGEAVDAYVKAERMRLMYADMVAAGRYSDVYLDKIRRKRESLKAMAIEWLDKNFELLIWDVTPEGSREPIPRIKLKRTKR